MLSFEKLTEARRSLQRFCKLHVPSLLALQSGISFKLTPEDPPLSSEKVHHLTTTATCLSSLFDCPPPLRVGEFKPAEEMKSVFANKALERPPGKWKSEGSAAIYCRCRALPMIIASSSEKDERIEKHIAAILGQLNKKKKSSRFGIGEAAATQPEDQWYPPNGFHTYWTLDILDEYKRLSSAELCPKTTHEGMLLWARQQLGYQLGLHSASPQSSMLDSDQLAWSLAVFLRFDEKLKVNLENRDFIKQALKCLFSTQTDGTWRHYKPLFHYKKAGNAYCYVFETFAALLQCALQNRPEAQMVRDLLKPYCQNLLDLWGYAKSTKIPLPKDEGVGWCSGHRTNVTSPESWATASVFSYAQALRRLVGIWAREEAFANLNTLRPRRDRAKAAAEMQARGETWGTDKRPASEQLWTTFVNPVRKHECNDRLEPDSRPIAENQARAAILFGPPGTSKTTLVRSLAEAIDWRYVEIHASHFVAEGLAEVQKTADRIFGELSELDHGVVLFDEIDELVRERDMEKDAFGRFLTTSMLPKLAELWENRKILYFVATNHINYFDSAIIRSHRFDVLMLVSPPSFKRKVDQLQRLLSDVHGIHAVTFSSTLERDIQRELNQIADTDPMNLATETVEHRLVLREQWREEELDAELVLAKFALLRWDELNELSDHLASLLRVSGDTAISTDRLRSALQEVVDSEWRKTKSYVDYLRDEKSGRRDYQMMNIWQVDPELPDTSAPAGVFRSNGLQWFQSVEDKPEKIRVAGYELTFKPLGSVTMRTRGSS